jgi:spermidine synthase
MNRLGLGALLLVFTAAMAGCSAHRNDGAGDGLIHQRASQHGAIYVNEDSAGFRTLRFAQSGARQSVVKMGDPRHLELAYASAALAGLALQPQPRRILVVGLGGGSLPSFLRIHYPQAVIDVAEIDRDVQAVRRALAPDGIAVGNVWSRSANPLYDAMLHTYEEAFEELCVISVQGDVNRIVLALPRRRGLDADTLARQARAVSTAQGFRFDLGDIVRSGWMAPAERRIEAPVLRDARP